MNFIFLYLQVLFSLLILTFSMAKLETKITSSLENSTDEKYRSLKNKTNNKNSTLDRDFIPAWRKFKMAKTIKSMKEMPVRGKSDNISVKPSIYKKDWIYSNRRPNLLKSPLRKQNDIIHKAVTKFLKSLAGKRSIYSRPKTSNYYALKKHLIPLTTENDILLSKKDISVTRYPFSKTEPNELTILKHATLDDIVNKAVDQVVAQIQNRKHKLQQLRANNTDPTIKRASMNSTHARSKTTKQINDGEMTNHDILMLSKVVEKEVVKKLENESKPQKTVSSEPDSKNNTEDSTSHKSKAELTDNKTINAKNTSQITFLLDTKSKNSSTNLQEEKEGHKNNTSTKEAFLDPFENVDSENASQLENDITKSAIEKAAANETLPVVEGEERMGYEIKDYYAAPSEEDTDSRDKIARARSRNLTHKTSHTKKPQTKINDVIKAFYKGGFNFLDGKGGFLENEDSFTTKESEDETRFFSNDKDNNKSLLSDENAYQNIKEHKHRDTSASTKNGEKYKCASGKPKIKISKKRNTYLQHKDYIETANDDPPSFDEINIDEKNLHLEAKIDSMESREKVMKDLLDVIKILRNLQPLNTNSDDETADTSDENNSIHEHTDTNVHQPVYPESVLDLQSDRPAPSTYTVTLNGNVYRLEKLNKETNAMHAGEDIESRNVTMPTTLILNIKTNEPNASYDFERIYNAIDKQPKIKEKETQTKILLDPSETVPVENPENITKSITCTKEETNTIKTACEEDANTSPTINKENSSILQKVSKEETKISQENQTFLTGEPDLEIESIENQSKNNRTVFIVHNKHHKTFKIEEVKEGESPTVSNEVKGSKQDVFEIRHNNKIFRVIELNETPNDCETKKEENEVELAKPCTPIHDDEFKHHRISEKPRDIKSLDSKSREYDIKSRDNNINEFAGRTIRVSYKNPTKNLETVREEVAKQISKENESADIIKILPFASFLTNSSKEKNSSEEVALQKNSTEDQKSYIFPDDDLSKVKETDQLDKMSAIKNEPLAESSGLFRDRIEKGSDDNYDTFIFQIPRSKEAKTVSAKTNQAENLSHLSVKKSTNYFQRDVKNENKLETNTDDAFEETLNAQVVP